MKFNYHPALGHRFHLTNGSEMYRERLRRMLRNPDNKIQPETNSFENRDNISSKEELEQIEESSKEKITLLNLSNLNVNT